MIDPPSLSAPLQWPTQSAVVWVYIDQVRYVLMHISYLMIYYFGLESYKESLFMSRSKDKWALSAVSTAISIIVNSLGRKQPATPPHTRTCPRTHNIKDIISECSLFLHHQNFFFIEKGTNSELRHSDKVNKTWVDKSEEAFGQWQPPQLL